MKQGTTRLRLPIAHLVTYDILENLLALVVEIVDQLGANEDEVSKIENQRTRHSVRLRLRV